MRGMAVRSQLYQALQDKKPIAEAVALAKIASALFEKAREIAPDDVHGYISETQMLIRLLDFCGANSPGGMLGYLASKDADPDMRDALDRAEDLLDQVQRFREGEEPDDYEERCRADLDRLHGRTENALQVWDSLLSRKGVYLPSVRRSIVWTYLARCRHSWEDLKPKEADRIVHLLGQNMNEEADNEKDLRLWVRAVRRVSNPPSIESVIERIAYWRANTGSLDASYYLYVLKAIQAIEGSTLALDESLRFLEECRKKRNSAATAPSASNGWAASPASHRSSTNPPWASGSRKSISGRRSSRWRGSAGGSRRSRRPVRTDRLGVRPEGVLRPGQGRLQSRPLGKQACDFPIRVQL